MARLVLVYIAVGAFVILGVIDLVAGRWHTGVPALLLAAANAMLLT